MKKLIGFLASTAVVASSMPTAAFAQTFPGTQTTTVTQQSYISATPHTAGQHAAVTRDTVTGGLRAVRQGDNSMAVMSMDEFIRQYRPPEAVDEATRVQMAMRSFGGIVDDNRNGCSETGEWVRESISIAGEAQEIDVSLQDLNEDLVRLGRAQNRAAGIATGAAVVSTGLLCALSLGLYCAAAAAGGLGNIAQTRSHRRTQRVDRDMRYVNVRQSRLQLRATLLTMRMNIGWARTFHDYCMLVFPNQTAGIQTASASSVTYWQPADGYMGREPPRDARELRSRPGSSRYQ